MTYYSIVKRIVLHKVVAADIQKLDESLRVRFAELFGLLASGESLGLPVSRPMSIIAQGVHELRVTDKTGQYRAFYYTKVKGELVIFHFLKKKSQATPKREIETAKKRLRSFYE